MQYRHSGIGIPEGDDEASKEEDADTGDTCEGEVDDADTDSDVDWEFLPSDDDDPWEAAGRFFRWLWPESEYKYEERKKSNREEEDFGGWLPAESKLLDDIRKQCLMDDETNIHAT